MFCRMAEDRSLRREATNFSFHCGWKNHFVQVETEGDTLLLQSIICENHVALSDILSRISMPYRKCRLGFTPAQNDMHMCATEKYDGADDYRLFYLGEPLKGIEKEKLYFLELSHA